MTKQVKQTEVRENIVDEIESVINETHEMYVCDLDYAENIVSWMERHHQAALSAIAEGTKRMLRIFSRKDSTDNDPFCGVAMGDKVKDTLTGFAGIVIARSEYLTGCNQLYVLPKSEKENEMKDGVWFDIERIEKIADLAVKIEPRRTGSDIPATSGTGARHEVSN